MHARATAMWPLLLTRPRAATERSLERCTPLPFTPLSTSPQADGRFSILDYGPQTTDQTILLSIKMMLGILQQVSDKVNVLGKMVDPYGASLTSRIHRSRMEVRCAQMVGVTPGEP